MLHIGRNFLSPIGIFNWQDKMNFFEESQLFEMYLRKSLASKEKDFRIFETKDPLGEAKSFFSQTLDTYFQFLYRNRDLLSTQAMRVNQTDINQVIYYLRDPKKEQTITLDLYHESPSYVKPIVLDTNLLAGSMKGSPWKPPRRDGRTFTLRANPVELPFWKDKAIELWELRITE